MIARRSLGIVTVAVVIVVSGGILGRWAYVQKQRANAKETQGSQRTLWLACEEVKARSVEQLQQTARERGFRIPFNDAWGNPFQVEFRKPTQSWNGCVVISLGRDGRRGSCCVKSTGWRWDEDSVYAEEWVQTWNYFNSGAEIAKAGGRQPPPN